MSQHYLSIGLGGEFCPDQGMSVAHQPQPVSPSEVVDINHRNSYALESSLLTKPRTENPEKLLVDPSVRMELLLRNQQKLLQQALGGTKPEDRTAYNLLNSAVMADQSKASHWSDVNAEPMKPNAHQVQASPTSFIVNNHQYESISSINPSTSHKVADSPASPMMQPRTEMFGKEERQEKEEIDFALRVGKKKSVKTSAHKSIMGLNGEDITKFKRKKGKNHPCSSQKESESGVLSPRPSPPRDPPLVTQPSQDQEASAFVPSLFTIQNGVEYETMQEEGNEDYHQLPYCTGHTCQVTEKEFLEVTQQLETIHQDGVWIVHHDLHPKGGAYREDHDFSVDYSRWSKGGFGTVFHCQDKISMKEFIQKLVPKERWRKAENIALMTLKGHPNICKLLGMKQESGMDGITLSLFLEDAGSSLSQFVRQTQDKKLPPHEIWDISKQMFCGLVHLHGHGILHLDLKPENICIKGSHESLTLKIIDFGSAKLSLEPFYFNGMTPEYLAPEVCTCFIAHQHGVIGLAETLISGKADVAAGALIILYMIEGYDVLIKPINNGQTSYIGNTPAEIKSLRAQLIMMHTYNPDLALHLISDGIDAKLKELLTCCLVGNPEKRFSSQQALQFIKEKENAIKDAQLKSSTAFLKHLEASIGLQDKFGVAPSNEQFQVLHHHIQQTKGKLRNFQQAAHAGDRMFDLNSQQEPHGTNNFSVKVSSRNKLRDKTEPYPAHRRVSSTEDQHTNGTIHPNATGLIPTTVNPETYPATPDDHGGNLPNFDVL